MEKKYELVMNDSIVHEGKTLYRIRAVRDIVNLSGQVMVSKGELGGYIEEERNLGQTGLSWIYNNGKVYDKATVYGDATGVLTGDALQAFAFEVIAKADMGPEMMRNQLEMMKVLAVGCGYQGMCGGQELDMEAENREVTREELEKVHKYKTGALIESSVELGLLCRKNMPEAEKEAFRAYSRAIGLAFQVWDDVLDIISNTDILGKPQGSDVESNKSTYPKLMGLDGAKEYAKSLALTAVNALKPLPYDTALLQDFAMFIVERDH